MKKILSLPVKPFPRSECLLAVLDYLDSNSSLKLFIDPLFSGPHAVEIAQSETHAFLWVKGVSEAALDVMEVLLWRNDESQIKRLHALLKYQFDGPAGIRTAPLHAFLEDVFLTLSGRMNTIRTMQLARLLKGETIKPCQMTGYELIEVKVNLGPELVFVLPNYLCLETTKADFDLVVYSKKPAYGVLRGNGDITYVSYSIDPETDDIVFSDLVIINISEQLMLHGRIGRNRAGDYGVVGNAVVLDTATGDTYHGMWDFSTYETPWFTGTVKQVCADGTEIVGQQMMNQEGEFYFVGSVSCTLRSGHVFLGEWSLDNSGFYGQVDVKLPSGSRMEVIWWQAENLMERLQSSFQLQEVNA